MLPIQTMTRILLAFGLACLPTGSGAAQAAVHGRVATVDGDPIAGARIEITDAGDGPGTSAVSDQEGRFAFPDVDRTIRVRVEHPRFETIEIEVAPFTTDRPMPVVSLVPKHQVFGELTVTATRGADSGYQPVSVAVSAVAPDERPGGAATLVALVEGVPGVAENGQGGRFQAYSIRGVAGQRVMTLVAGARIVTERRAGATASFIDPMLLERAEVVRGPFSSYYGSGALGGLVEAFPRRFDALAWNVGYDSQGGQSFQQLGVGWRGWSLGLSHRRANDGETPDGERLFNRYQQWSASLSRKWELRNGATLEFAAIPAVARDIGKPNADFPERTTLYPEENHLVARLMLRTPSDWRIDLWGHPNELVTRDLEGDERALVDNDAFDYGFNAQKELELAAGFSARFGLDYFGRRGVRARETTTNTVTGETSVVTSLDGRHDELGVYASVQRNFGALTVAGGGRYTWLEQANRGAAVSSDGAVTGFVGLTAPLGDGFELAANVGTGFRFPGLSERFFTGTTGRGEIIANGDLDPERSISVDLGFRYYGDKLYLELFGYHNDIDDYIERIRLPSGARTFVNLTAGTIEGLELAGFYQLSDALRLSFEAQRSRGTSDSGEALSDIPSARVSLGLAWQSGAWRAAGRYEHRFDKDRIGSGEQPTRAAEIFSASVSYRLASGLAVSLSATNLLDETYLPSADDLAVPASGRSVGLSLGWNW